MYFTVGWPKYLERQNINCLPISVFCNRDRTLFGVLTEDSISIWYIRPCVEVTCYRRSKESIAAFGANQLAEWKPDSLMIVVTTCLNHLLFYNVDIDDSVKSLYEQLDSKISGLRRESDELFIKGKVPPISLDHVHTLCLHSQICSLVCIRDELMVTTIDGHFWRVHWEGQLNEDYTLNLGNISFCLDQLQSRGLTFDGSGFYVKSMEYSPIIGGFSVVLSNGQAAFITATTLKFEPHQVFGILAQDIQNATCTAVNHRYRLIAYGLKNAQGVVFCVDDITGALQTTHQLILSSKDFPDVASAAGAVSNLKWTPDGGALAMTWEKGGLALWSVFGALLMCSLGWDYGSADIMKNVLTITSLEWGPEGYHLWTVVVNSLHSRKKCELSVPNRGYKAVAVFQFVKSALTVNAGMTGREHVFLQAEDRLYISAGSDIIHNKPTSFDRKQDHEVPASVGFSRDQMLFGNKQWIVIPIPYAYLGNNWPIRYTAIDSQGQSMAVAGRSGLAHYSLLLKRWKLFGNETQERDFVVMGGLLWWEDQIILGCFNLRDLRDEIRVYPQDSKLDNQFVRVVKMDSQVLQLSALGDRLLSFCADSHLTLFLLQRKTSPTSSVLHITRLLELDVTNLVFHPACVVSTLLTSLCTETVRWPRKGDESILINICGRLLLLQQDPVSRTSDAANNNTQKIPSYGLPTVLASCVENVWVCSHSSKDTPHLTEALWIACGAHGMRVWLPLFPRDGEKQRAHNFMSKRIMLPVPVYIYPLAVLYEDAVILGAENETVLLSVDSYDKHPFSIVSRTSQVYLHHILRQLLKRNLGYHAWEIARSCSTLPYFPHSLELLLHEILEEEATSSDPIPDALLPRIIDFIQEFPVFLQTVVQCARKTELALWPYLFSAVGNPKNLFQACLNQGQLDTAASYLIILQNLELSSVSQQHATLLLDSSLEAGKWELANELVRFLKAIDPSDNESLPRSFNPPNKYGLPHSTPPVSPTEDDLSFVLGTVSLTRGRSHSTTVTQKLASSTQEKSSRIQHQDISRTISDPHNIPRKRRISDHKEKGTSEEFFIDTLLARHARKLLRAGKLKDLGYFAAYLDFHLVTFFSKERSGAAHVDDFIRALFTLHQDFQWPFPLSSAIFSSYSVNKNSGYVNHFLDHKTIFADSSYKPFNSPVKLNELNANDTPDNGYGSNLSEKLDSKNISNVTSNSSLSTVREQTIEARLSPKLGGDSLLNLDVSENSSLWTEESLNTLDDESLSNMPLPTELEAISEELASRGPLQTEVQLRYLLQLLLEAGCLDWSLLIAIILRDAMAVIRVVNLAKQPDQPQEILKHLRDGMASIEQWAERECSGYKAFMHVIHNQAKALSKKCSPSSSLLKLDMQPASEEFCSDVLYSKEQSSHRLSTSSDIPGIEGTLVLQGTQIDKDDESSLAESAESLDSPQEENQTSECSIS
ncbi:guanine nucleotide exchange factor subunit RIC1-like isoform X2 [Stegodyphus dumicola]|uniref:guanine nucleotide exchange factor subunit RIC1-like isoform X2 n=1 Tax=Stegodyphus dumicola TaxID=202533 RepID=UPI0015A9E968|nr:guanine nucleotide exchange factor subunit RIC1-like isoform X2 [Stegodyphus dumicola]